MDVLALLQLLARRWLVVIPVTLLAIGGVAYAYTSAPPVYRAGGSVVLLNPPAGAELPQGQTRPAAEDNPYTRFGDLSVVVDIVVRRMRTPDVDSALRSDGFSGTLTVGANLDFYNGPIIDITVEAGGRDAAVASARQAMDEIDHQLQLLQGNEGTDSRYFVRTAVVVEPNEATVVFSATLRRLIAAAAVSLGAILGAAILAEGFARRRANRRKTKATKPPTPPKQQKKPKQRVEPEPQAGEYIEEPPVPIGVESSDLEASRT